jgi:hypothetical protein
VPTPQSFENHFHRPTPTIITSAFWLLAWVMFALRWFGIGGRVTMALGLAAILGAIFTLAWISRLYTTRLQDRIIRLEMRVRGQQLLSPEQQRMLAGLTIKQVAALRFASDAELPELCERAAREQLPPTDIKRAVRHWTPDYDRT